jgi:HNH endonuclease
MKFCSVCNSEIKRSKKESTPSFKKRKYCSLECFWTIPKPKGSNHPSWKGGRYTTEEGYIRLHTVSGKQILEHRLVMEQKIGRPMLPTETVHHRNGIRSDNRPENLELRVGQHGKGSTVHCPTCSCSNN